MRYGVYLANDVELYNILFSYKARVEEELGFPCHWKHGTKGENARRIYCEKKIIAYNRDSYMDAIDESLPRLLKFAELFDHLI